MEKVEAEQVVTHQPVISSPISFQHPFNCAGGRTSNVRQKTKQVAPKMKALIVALFSMTLMACGENHPLSKTEPAKSAPFSVDLGRAFHFELGRGSGMDGLDTVSFGLDGVVTLFRQQPAGKWQTTAVRIGPEAIARIFAEVKAQGIMKMPAAYHADVYDGTQWVLWIQQDEKSKAIYFNNYFPKEARALAALVDKELASAGLSNAAWKDVPPKKSREHEKALWNSLKQS